MTVGTDSVGYKRATVRLTSVAVLEFDRAFRFVLKLRARHDAFASPVVRSP